jgi:cell division septation protein DedD
MRPEVSPDFQDYKYYSYYYSYGEEGKEKGRRDRKKGWAFLRRKGEKESKEAKQAATERDEGTGSEKKEVKKGTSRRLFLLLVATAILAVGILWHNNLIDPFKDLDKKEPVKREVKRKEVGKRVSETPVARRPERISPPAKPVVSKKEDQLEKRNSAIESPPASKTVADIKAPKPQKKTPEPGPPTKKETVSSRPKPTVSVDKAPDKTILVKESLSETSIPKESASVSAKAGIPAMPKKAEPPAAASMPKSSPVSTEAAVTETAPVPEKIVSYPYSLYLGSFQNLERAKKAVSLYGAKGVSAYWVKVLLSKGTWYRVYAGYFEDSEKAQQLRREKGLKEATIEETPYANLIGAFTSSDEVEDRISYLRNLGYSPYAVKDPGGKFRLYVGAFYPEYRAKRQYKELNASGVQSRVVKR